MTMNLLDRCKEGLREAQKAGADEAEVYGSSIRKTEIALEKNDLQVARSHREEEIGIRVFKDKGLGFVSVNEFENLKGACRDAVSLAEASPSDEYNVLPEPEEIDYVAGIYDPQGPQFQVEDALGHGLEMLSRAKDYDPRIMVAGGTFVAEVATRAVVNSKGVEGEERESLFAYYLFGMAAEDDRVSAFDIQVDGTRLVGEIDVAKVARRFAENVIGSLGAEKGESFKGAMLLSPDAAVELLVGPILFSVNANNVQKGMSRFAGKLGKSVAATGLTIEDDGTVSSGLGSSSFDREGLPHQPLTIIKDGQLVDYLHNTYTAAKEGQPSTGHAAGGARFVPSIGPTNLMIAAGPTSKEELIGEISNGIIVTRFSGNTDPVSGDFSGVVKGGFLVKDGRVVKPIIETLVAGNVFELLPRISGISKERKKVLAGAHFCLLPHIRMEEVSVTAG